MIWPSLDLELDLAGRGYVAVAGVDEVGRGAWAGPVVAGAIILPTGISLNQAEANNCLPRWLRDSKTLTHQQRQTTSAQLKQLTSAWAIGQAEVDEIAQLGIVGATFLAMERAISGLSPGADFVLVDGLINSAWPANKQLAMVKGDAKSASIAAASILAKVYRDQLMDELDSQYPDYGLAQHKGYGTAAHRAAIDEHGLSPIHRKNFRISG